VMTPLSRSSAAHLANAGGFPQSLHRLRSFFYALNVGM
jgi:hypothetical protein